MSDELSVWEGEIALLLNYFLFCRFFPKQMLKEIQKYECFYDKDCRKFSVLYFFGIINLQFYPAVS